MESNFAVDIKVKVPQNGQNVDTAEQDNSSGQKWIIQY